MKLNWREAVLKALKEHKIASGVFSFYGKTIIPRSTGVYAAPDFYCQRVSVDSMLLEQYMPVQGENNVFRPKNLAPGEKEEGFEPDSVLIAFGNIGYEFFHDWKTYSYKGFLKWFEETKKYLRKEKPAAKA